MHFLIDAGLLYLLLLSAWHSDLTGILVFGLLAAVIVFHGWWFASASLVLRSDQFVYRIWRKEWLCFWQDPTGFGYSGRSANGRVYVTWKSEGPEFMWPNAKMGPMSQIVCTFGLKPLELAQLMARFRERALYAEQVT